MSLAATRLAAVLAAAVLVPSAAPAAESAGGWDGPDAEILAYTEIAGCFAGHLGDDRHACVLAPFEACYAALGDDQPSLNLCAGRAAEGWSLRLQQAVETLESEPDADFARAFRDSQARWRAWTDADCDLQAAPFKGGSMYAMQLSLCLARHDGERTIELEALF